MKKSILISIVILLSFITLTFSSEIGGGSASDPLVTEETVNDILDSGLDDLLDEKLEAYEPSTELAVAATIVDKVSTNSNNISYVQNDSFSLKTGDKFLLRSGTVAISGTGSLINVTDGVEVVSPTSLSYNKYYVVAENSTFTMTVTSLTAKLSTNLDFVNPYTAKYTGYADALASLNLFKGTDYGYDLNRSATRIESLIMLIRILGEETEALASTATHPFTDVASWADSYVAYAYEQGYTVGQSDTIFGSDQTVSYLDYYTFLLRALNYEDNVDFTWSGADIKALEVGIIDTAFDAECKVTFYRDQIAHVSYNLLDVTLKNSELTLADELSNKGIINLEDYAATGDLIK